MFGASGSFRPAKRQRLSDYPPGSIIKVEVKNFMTYAHTVIEPGSRLNLVLGPNGTGKSSFVCALCVGLAGSIKLLGRAENVSSFVRRGTQSGEVTITLAGRDPARPHVIRRQIFAHDNSSKWWVNSRESKQAEVVTLVQDLNIQLDNLCQFLPQDKVVSFAGMSPVQLLSATEAAVGNTSLSKTHTELIEARANLRVHDASIAEISQELTRLRQENERTEKTLAPLRDRERLTREAEDLRLKVPWAEFKEANDTYCESKAYLKDIEKKLATMKKRRREQDAPLVAKKKEMESAAASEKKAREAYAKADLSVRIRGKDRQEIVDDMIQEATSKKERVDGLEAEAAHRRDKIACHQQDITKLERDLEEITEGMKLNQDKEKRRLNLEREKKDLGNQENLLRGQIDECVSLEDEALRAARGVQAQLDRLSDAKESRMRGLETRHKGLRQAWQWVLGNQSRFRGHVLGPIAMEIGVGNQAHAAMLEQHVPNNWWSHFIVQFQEDQDLLRKELHTHCDFRANICFYRGDPAAPLNRQAGNAEDFRQFGVVASLDQTFDAPPLVKHVLNDNFYIGSAFVMATPDANWEELYKANSRLQVVWTPENQIRQRTSRYNAQAVSTSVIAIRPATIFGATNGSGGGGMAGRAALEQALADYKRQAEEARLPRGQLEQDVKEVEGRIRRLDQEISSLNATFADLMKRNRIASTRLTSKRNELKRLEASPDPLCRREELEKEAKTGLARATAASCQLAEAYSKSVTLCVAHTEAELAYKELVDQIKRMSAVNQQHVEDLSKTENLVSQLRDKVHTSKTRAENLEEKAKEATGWPLPEGLGERFALLPSSPKELQRLAEEKSDEAQGVFISDPSALQRYNQRKGEISQAENKLSMLQSHRDIEAATIDQLKSTWVPALREIVDTINRSFSVAFPAVGVAGEVVLFEAPEDDFANYAIEIRVKFREEESLTTLDSNRQSGGERSVSTILYLVALQGVAAAPFRVVDEINQGMDAANERKVFKQLVDAATAPGTPQCFLLTPKVLPDLPFSREVSVLQIMNGRHIRDVASGFRPEHVLGARRMQLLTARS